MKFPVLFPVSREFGRWRRVRLGLRPPPTSVLFCLEPPCRQHAPRRARGGRTAERRAALAAGGFTTQHPAKVALAVVMVVLKNRKVKQIVTGLLPLTVN
jgi:hypothetical protein